MHPNLIDASSVALLIVDMQEAFAAKIPGFDEAARRIAAVATAFGLLQLPVLLTEQYPKGLGRTVQPITSAVPADNAAIEKTAFSACGCESFGSTLDRIKPRQILICGIEAHVCVCQTTHDLLHRGYQVHLLTDCILSRASENRQVGLSKMQLAGAIPSSTEIAIFELLRDSRHAQFKAVQQLIK